MFFGSHRYGGVPGDGERVAWHKYVGGIGVAGPHITLTASIARAQPEASSSSPEPHDALTQH